MKISLWSLLTVAGIAAALLWLVPHGGAEPLAAWLSNGKREVQTVHTLLARHDAYVRQTSQARKVLSDSLTRLTLRVQVMRDSGAGLLAQAQTVSQLRAAAFVFARAGQVCAQGLALCQQRGDSLFKADSAHTDSLRAALKVADTTLARGVQLASCKFLLVLPCLSRARSFELGGVLGILGTLVLVHH